MISTEVQRTLVKSPPELWAELSDPASLARHLDELGDVRITRTEPEKTVEWEAERTSGKVQIKPSGWGTRVTLTVTREVPEADAAAAPQDATEPLPEQHSPGPAPSAADIAVDPVGDQMLQWRPQTAAGAARTHAWRSRDRLTDPTDGEDSAPAHEQPPEPAAEAAHSAEPDLAPDADTGAELLEVEAERLESEPETSGRLAWLAYEAEQSEPRRGFLARLFGRRRMRAAEPEPAAALSPAGAEGEEAEEIVAEQPEADALDSVAAVAAEDPPEAMLAPEGPDPADSADLIEHPPAPQPRPDATAPWAREASASAGAFGPTPGSRPSESAPASTAPVADLSAELEVAEEAATAEVTAVLTAVLDRLGAAHHRPFSRA
jgi:hypothetical protein